MSESQMTECLGIIGRRVDNIDRHARSSFSSVEINVLCDNGSLAIDNQRRKDGLRLRFPAQTLQRKARPVAEILASLQFIILFGG